MSTYTLPFVENDGGRAAAGFRGHTGDCAVRAAAIATGLPYQEVYDTIKVLAERERPRGRKKRSHPRTGVWPGTLGCLLEQHGFVWTATMQIGSGCVVHLRTDELPPGTLVCRVSKHYTTVIDHVLHDIFNCSRSGSRCVYGYWHRA